MRSWIAVVLVCVFVSKASVAEVFNLAVPEDAYPPYIVMDEQGEVVSGLLIDPLKEALAALAVDLKIHTVPIQRSRLMLEVDQMDGVMHSPNWVEDDSQLLWLDLGVWIEDKLYVKGDSMDPPQNIQHLNGAELITHMGYIYPKLEPLIQQGKIKRIDKYNGEEMIQALVATPRGAQRFMVMDDNVWQWYQSRVPMSQQLRRSSVLVGCAPLQIRLAVNQRMQRLQPRIQKEIKPHQNLITTKRCQQWQQQTLSNTGN